MMQIFCDFDGTITKQDVGQQLFLRFGDPLACDAAVAAWKQGRISSIEMYKRECAAARLTLQKLEKLAAGQELDAGFLEFVQRCKRHEDELVIVSDGFLRYIKLILEKHGLGDLPVYGNDIRFLGADRIAPVFPFARHTCGACANCKGYQVRKHRRPGVQTVYIGDGLSDRCGALEADVVFAKGELAEYCQEQGLPFIHFADFADINEAIDEIRITKAVA